MIMNHINLLAQHFIDNSEIKGFDGEFDFRILFQLTLSVMCLNIEYLCVGNTYEFDEFSFHLFCF